MKKMIPLWLLVPLCAFAQTAADDEQGAQPLFENQDTLQVRIEAPLTTLLRERSDTEYLDGTLSYTDASGAEQQLDLELRARGRYRRARDTCSFPPVRLNFKKSEVAGTEFAGQDKLKLVTHCRNGSDTYEQYVLKEYLAYKLLNAMTEYSFGARLFHVTWVDSERDGKTQLRYGFVIEDDERVAERIGAEVVKSPMLTYGQLDAEQANLVAVFEYFIGNTDFSMVHGAKDDDCCHNVVPFSRKDGAYLPVPYDFDFSGIVNARYAEPNPKLKIASVTRRLYRGLCDFNPSMDATVARFRDNETALRQTASSIEGMEAKERDRALKYIDGFYDDISDASSVEKNLIRKCASTE
ncbi:MAG: hypothetical protein WD795_03190 [Woeseia sp.]